MSKLKILNAGHLYFNTDIHNTGATRKNILIRLKMYKLSAPSKIILAALMGGTVEINKSRF